MDTYYGDYLRLSQLLDTQHPKSATADLVNGKHDEMLFIVVHQVFELWFKQILHEIDHVLKVFSQKNIAEEDIQDCLKGAQRIEKIQSLFSPHLDILETMTPMDFLEFRDLLIPASGFQSRQFREVEIKLGLGFQSRSLEGKEYFLGRFNQEDQDYLKKIEQGANLFEQLESWLERMPFTLSEEFNFWEDYREKVHEHLENNRKMILNHPALNENEKEVQIQNLGLTVETFDSLFDPKKFQAAKSKNKKHLSQKSTLNALFIFLYRQWPILNTPFNFLNSLINVDENFTSWRYRHALLAHRMVGTKVGTGGSAGHQYLKRTADNNRLFKDLFDLSTFFIPHSQLPELPSGLKEKLSFNFNS